MNRLKQELQKRGEQIEDRARSIRVDSEYAQIIVQHNHYDSFYYYNRAFEKVWGMSPEFMEAC